MVAMTPLITIQILGMVYQLRKRQAARRVLRPAPVCAALADLAEDAIIEL